MTPLYDLPRRSSRGVATGTTPPLPVPVPGSGPGLTKKRKSSVNVRAVSQSHNKLPVQNGHGSVRYSIGASTLGSEKKGSFRNAVRKLFGRKSKVEEEVPVQRSPPRHGYHRSVRSASLEVFVLLSDMCGRTLATTRNLQQSQITLQKRSLNGLSLHPSMY